MASEKWNYYVHLTAELSGGAERLSCVQHFEFITEKSTELLA